LTLLLGLLSQPIPDRCRVDDDLSGRLRPPQLVVAPPLSRSRPDRCPGRGRATPYGRGRVFV